jgi:hypothetical protein
MTLPPSVPIHRPGQPRPIQRDSREPLPPGVRRDRGVRDRMLAARSDMTICIAAAAKLFGKIVAVFETKIGNDSYSQEYGSMKLRKLANRWLLMYSGQPSDFAAAQRHINQWLVDHNRPIDIESMIDAIQHAYATEFRRAARREILSPLGLDDEWLSTAMATDDLSPMTAGIVERVLKLGRERSDDVNGLELLAIGFHNRDGHILRVAKDGKCYDAYDEGFDTIGSGGFVARTYLQTIEQLSWVGSLGEVCYHAQVAKFMAETSPYVGTKQTITIVLDRAGGVSMNYGADDARKHFDTERARQVPEETLKAIEASLQAGFV